MYYGSISRLQALKPALLDPRRRHGVTDFDGERVVLVGYCINTLGRDVADYVTWLEDLGFNVPLHVKEPDCLLDDYEPPSSSRLFALRVGQPKAVAGSPGGADSTHYSPRSETLAPTRHAQYEGSSGGEAFQGNPASDRSSVVKEGGWSEKVGISGGEIDFSVNWSLRFREGEGQCAAVTAPQDPRRGSLKKRASPGPRRSVSLPLLPDGWGDRQETGGMDISSCNAVKRLSACDFEPRRVGDLLVQPKDGPTVTVQVEEDPAVRKVEPTFLKNPESLLASLTEPLQVVYTVDPADAAKHLDKWVPALRKELAAVEAAIRKLTPRYDEYEGVIRDSSVVRIPAKLVFTLKPHNQGSAAALEGDVGAVASNPDAYYRRKVRLVCCGNFAPQTGMAAYASGSTPDALRLVLTEASHNAWRLGTLHITSAFLATPIPEDGSMPV